MNGLELKIGELLELTLTIDRIITSMCRRKHKNGKGESSIDKK